MIEDFYTTTFTKRRVVYVGYVSSYQDAGTFLGHLQQASQLVAVNDKNQPTVTHTAWCAPDNDLRSEDELLANGRSFKVHGIQRNTHAGGNVHLEVLLEQTDIISA